MSKPKIQALRDFLVDANYRGHRLANAAQIDYWIEGGKVEPAAKRVNGNGLIAARFIYSGVISINPCFAPAALICVYASNWVQNNTGKQDECSIEFSADANDDNSNEVELVVGPFCEDIELVQAEGGPFVFGGVQYDFGDQSLWIAEQFTLLGQVEC